MADTIWYVYGVVPADLDLAGAPPGIDDAPVTVERDSGLAALVSRLAASVYSPEEVEARTGDLQWLGPRAVAHDRVVTWASDTGAVVPLPMFSLFSDGARVRAMLRERAADLQSTLAKIAPGREYTLRLFRFDDALRGELGAVSQRIAELEAQAREADPGRRYLLQRKLDAERTAEVRRVGANVAREVYAALAARSLAAITDALPQPGEGVAGTAVLNASFLVGRDALTPFREVLTHLATRYDGHGFRFEFTGPWPPYHFVRGADGR
jgi:gas vesicle protein GvpL/GvpF